MFKRYTFAIATIVACCFLGASICIWLYHRHPPYYRLNLPTYHNLNNFQASHWHHYYQQVYHSAPQASNFPIHLNQLNLLYNNELQRAHIPLHQYALPLPWCPIYSNQLYLNMSIRWDPPHSLWLYKKPPFHPAASNTWVEVTHTGSDQYYNYLKLGNWMYMTKGSGVYFYTGKTIAFQDHPDAVRYFLHSPQCTTDHQHDKNNCYDQLTRLFKKARQAGYDSIQFLDHGDQRCGLSAAEIVDLKGDSNYACGSQHPSNTPFSKRFRTGYNHEIPCICAANKANPLHGSLNCNRSPFHN